MGCLLGALLLITGPSIAQAGLSDSDTDNVRNLLLLSGVAIASHRRDLDGLRQFGSSVLLTSGITLATKSLIDSERPNREDNDSFPSGHAATAFAGAGFLHRRYGLKFGIPAYLAASSVALSRVDSDHHRLIDVAAGGLIALVVNQYLVTTPMISTPLMSTTLMSTTLNSTTLMSATPTLQISATNLSVGIHVQF